MSGLDPIGLQVLVGGLRAACDEMGATLIRSAYSANIKERHDCSTALFDAAGELVMQAEHIPVHLGSMPDAVAAVLGEEQRPGRDWILTRILWLSGTEVGKNRLGKVDTMRRYIYIHGTPDSTELGVPGSIGCVRMGNAALVELFELVPTGTPVEIA